MNIGKMYASRWPIDSRRFVFFRLSADTSQYSANKTHKSSTAMRGVIPVPRHATRARVSIIIGFSTRADYMYYASAPAGISPPSTPDARDRNHPHAKLVPCRVDTPAHKMAPL